MLTGQSLEMSLTHEDSPPPLTQVEGKVESLDSATYLGGFYLFYPFFLLVKEKKTRFSSTTEILFITFPYSTYDAYKNTFYCAYVLIILAGQLRGSKKS